MSGKKKGLGTVVECSETGDEQATMAPLLRRALVPCSSPSKDEQATMAPLLRRAPSEQPNTGQPPSVDRRRRATFGGSLFSLFFSRDKDRDRQASHAGNDKMSRSANDLHDTTALSNNGSDTEDGKSSCSEVTAGGGGGVVISPLSSTRKRNERYTILSALGKKSRERECPLCYVKQSTQEFPKLTCCSHRSCRTCLIQYLQVEIMESRVAVSCPECSELLHPSDVHFLMSSQPSLIDKYESFCLRRCLMTDPDTRWCPAPDCTYAIIAAGCAACPELRCERPGCGTLFCYHCKMSWHPNQTCDQARRERGMHYRLASRSHIVGGIENHLKPGDIKACPRCRTYIVKMNDGSCNHMVCAMCSAEFCWLCLKEISDLHYLSPTGCTFWGKKPWTRKKKLLWQLGTLIGAPVGIALIAGLAIPGIIFGVPIFVGRKVHQRFIHYSKGRRRLLTVSSVAGSLIVSPVLAVMAVGVGVPIMLAYVYGVVPLSLCRSQGGCGMSASSSHLQLETDEDDNFWQLIAGSTEVEEKTRLLNESTERTGDGTSLVTGYSIGSGLSSSAQQNQRLQVQAELCRRRPSVESGIASIGDRCNYEEASTKAMSGSQYCYDDKSVHTVCSAAEAASYCDEVASTKALAGSVLDSKSLFDSASLRTDSRVVHTRDLSPAIVEGHTEEYRLASLVEDADFSQRAGPSHELSIGQRGRRGRALSNGSGQSMATPNIVGHSIGDEGHEDVLLMSEEVAMQTIEVFNSRKHRPESRVDPLHLRTLIDAMREMVSDDHPASSNSTSASQHRMKRTGSNNSLNTGVSNGGRPVVNSVKTSRDSSGVSVRYENSDSVATETAPVSTSRRFFQRFRYRGRR